MAWRKIEDSKLTAIANAIRAKSGKSDQLNIEQMAAEINNLSAEEIIQHVNIPDYVKEEALRVAQAVQSVRKDDSIVFLAMSDNHHYGEQKNSDQYPDAKGIQTDESNLHSAMAAKILAYALKFDFMAQMGDMTWGAQKTTSALLHDQMDELISFLRESHKDIPCFHAIGNHDTGIYYHNQQIEDGQTGIFTESGEWLYNNFTALSTSDNTVFGGQANGGYCYRDFPDKKLRVFLLNTSEALVVNQQDKATLGSQRKWFADALVNLNDKSDASAWSFMVLSHYPADYGNTMPLSELLKAYVEGSSITVALESGSSATVNFSGKNSAKMIAQFHGHVHNFLTSKLYTYQSNQGVKYDAWRVCIPNGQFDRENYYTTVGSYTDINFKQDTTYEKTADTAKDTSFVINVINPSEQIIHSICYGAGIDRVISYGETVYYNVSYNLTNALISNAVGNIEEGTSYTTTLTPGIHSMITSVKITMGGADITASAYNNGTINIDKVTGDIVITAVAEIALACTNQIPISTDASGAIYNGVGYKDKVYLHTTGGVDSGHSATAAVGYIPVKIGDVIRLRNMDFNKNGADNRLAFYNSDKTFITIMQANSVYYMETMFNGVLDGDNYIELTLADVSAFTDVVAYMRICCANITSNSIVTVNEEIKYVDELADSYVVTNNLTNAVNSNTSVQVAGGQSYTATISANSGYELKKVTVTMGGVDITSRVYANGIIHIQYVTGNVAITATAVAPATYTNQIPISTDADGAIYNGKGWKENTYLSSGNEGVKNGYYTTGFIPCTATSNVYLENMGFKNLDGYSRLMLYDNSKAYLAGVTTNATTNHDFWFPEIDSNGNVTHIYMTNYKPATAYIRLCCSYIGDDSIITVDEEIV